MSKGTSQSSQPIPPNPPRAPRTKSVPKKLQRGVDAAIPGVGVVIPQGSTENPKKRDSSSKAQAPSPKRTKMTSTSKAKGKQQPSGKGSRRKQASTAVTSSDSFTLSDSVSEKEQESVPSSLYVHNATEEIKLHRDAPEGFKVASVPLPPGLNAKFREQYSTRGFCAVVSVNLEQVYRECNIDLSPWFGPYQSFVSIDAQYYPDLVKKFYFNMMTDHHEDPDGNVIEERITTSARGVEFTISAAILNRILKVTNPPEASTPRYSNEEIYTTLIPGKEVPDDQKVHLSFKPADMSPLHRVIWHIYSRNFVQKGGSYTHFTQKDYRFFTAFIKKHPLNIGQWLFKEIHAFKFVSRRVSYMPFASLISLIMFYHKVWYVGPPAEMKEIPPFGATQLRQMKITFPMEGSGQSQAPQRSQTYASQPVTHEAQSAPPSLPADFDQRIRMIVDAAMTTFLERVQSDVGKLGMDVKTRLDGVIANQEDLQAQLVQMKDESEKTQGEISDQLIDLDARLTIQMTTTFEARDKINQLIQHFDFGGSSSTFGFTTVPSTSTPTPPPQTSSPSFAFPSPPHQSSSPASASTPATVVLSSPLTPSTEILPSPSLSQATASVLFPSTPPVIILPPSDPPTDPLLDDAKGGEDEKDV